MSRRPGPPTPPPPPVPRHRGPRWRLVVLGVAVLLAASAVAATALALVGGSGAGVAGRTASPAALVTQVDFVSADSGWVGVRGPGGGTVLATVDGGRRWVPQLALPGMTPDWVHFVDPTHGFVLASGTSRPPGPDQLYRTVDGGAHWTPTSLPKPETVYFPGGLVSFADADHGWYLSPAFEGFRSEDFTLYATSDGGATWSPLLTADIGHPVSHGMSNEGTKTGLLLEDTRTGWAGQIVTGHATLWSSSNGGADWEERQLPAPAPGWGDDAPVQVGLPTVFPDGTGAVEAFTFGSPGSGPGLRAYTYTTADGGLTWTDPRPLAGPSFGGAGPSPIVFSTASRWWYGAGPALYVTDDAGEHWRRAGAAPGGYGFAWLDGPVGTRGWAVVTRFGVCSPGAVCRARVVASQAARTDDGGRQWSIVPLPPGSSPAR